MSVTERLSATTGNVANKQSSAARFVRGSYIKLVTDSWTISLNYVAVTVSHGLVRDFITPEICASYKKSDYISHHFGAPGLPHYSV
jgi:hypothetical protein